MSKLSISQISLKQLLIAAFLLVVVFGVIFWYSDSHRGTNLTVEQMNEESKRAEQALREAAKNIPPLWQDKKR